MTDKENYAKDNEKDYTIANELEQCEIADKIADFAEEARKAVSGLRTGMFSGLDLDELEGQIKERCRIGNLVSEGFSQLNQEYKDKVGSAFQDFNIDNDYLIREINQRVEDKLGEE